MTETLAEISAQVKVLKEELIDLRATFKGVSKNYLVALSSLSDLTIHSAEAAKRAANSTEQSKIAAMNAMLAAREAFSSSALMRVVEAAVTASIAAALAAVESAAASAAAAAAAAAAVAHQAEASLLKASSEASTASRMAAESAAEAVKLSIEARQFIVSAQVSQANSKTPNGKNGHKKSGVSASK